MKIIDLHVHSCHSDGTMAPKELVTLAQRADLSAFALTDHDTVDGIEETALAAQDTGIEIVPGIEFSTRWQHRDIHILGYYINYQDPSFRQELQDFMEARDRRNEKMCARIREYTGFPVTLEKLADCYPGSVITRAHMAAWMVDEGYVHTRNIAFDKYLGDHAPCFVPKEEITPADAIRLILRYGGIPVLAHPLLYSLSRKQLYALIEELKDAGLMGIEAIYVMNKGNETAFMRAVAEKYGLLITGGSDFHGKNKPDISLGTGRFKNLSIPYSILEQLKAARN